MPLLIRPRPLSRARAAARPCASSRGLRQASSRGTSRPQCPPPSESTPHEPAQHPPPLRRSVSLVQGQQRWRSLRPVFSVARQARSALAFLLSANPNLIVSTARLPQRSARRVRSSYALNGRGEIPMERAEALPPTSRGFLPWRLSYDGHRCKPNRRDGAVIRNPSH